MTDLEKLEYAEKFELNEFETNYYGGENNPYEAIKIIQAHELNFAKGNVIKYVLRAGKKNKNKEIEDLEKARDYINFEINKLKK